MGNDGEEKLKLDVPASKSSEDSSLQIATSPSNTSTGWLTEGVVADTTPAVATRQASTASQQQQQQRRISQFNAELVLSDDEIDIAMLEEDDGYNNNNYDRLNPLSAVANNSNTMLNRSTNSFSFASSLNMSSTSTGTTTDAGTTSHNHYPTIYDPPLIEESTTSYDEEQTASYNLNDDSEQRDQQQKLMIEAETILEEEEKAIIESNNNNNSNATATAANTTTTVQTPKNQKSVSNPSSGSLLRYFLPWGRGGTTGHENTTNNTDGNNTGGGGAAPLATTAAANMSTTPGGGINITTATTTPSAAQSTAQQAVAAASAHAQAQAQADDQSSSAGNNSDDASYYEEEELSWAEDDEHTDSSSYDSVVVNDKPVDWNNLPVLPNRFCITMPPNAQDNTESSTKTIDYGHLNDDDIAQAAQAQTGGGTPHYLDTSVLQNAHLITVKEADEFVAEHGTLLQAVLQLLAEREQVGVEGSLESTDNIWKKGPLKKLSFAVGRRKHQRPAVAGAWKVKYVELRQGNLCYYEDNARTGRKTIHLRQVDTVVQESSYRGPGFVFELLVQGSPTKYWMASSAAERKAWIKAIQQAMIGDDIPRKELDLQPYEDSLKVFTSLRESLQQADTQEQYLAAIQTVLKEVAALQVPVQWVRERIENDLSPLLLGRLKPPKFSRSAQKQLKSSISTFWKNMGQTTFSINGLTVPRSSQLASERIVGALARCILEFDKAYIAAEIDDAADEMIDLIGNNTSGESKQISELQGVSYARNILLTVLRSREQCDISVTVKYLLENPGVMVVERKRNINGINNNNINNNSNNISNTIEEIDEPVHLEISFAGEDLPDDFLPDSEEMATWVLARTRRKNTNTIAVSSSKWKQRKNFVVLSGSVLSYYEAATPRPHGLRGQLVLNSNTTVTFEGEELVSENAGGGTGGGGNSNNSNNNATTDYYTTSGNNNKGGTTVRYVLCIASERRQDRLLSFESKADAEAWKDAIQEAIDSAGSIQNPPRVVTTTTLTSFVAPGKMLKGAERAIKVAADGTIQGGIRVIRGAKDGGIRVIKGAKDGGIRVIKSATDSGFKVIRGAVGRLRPNNRSMNNDNSDRRRPSLQMLLNNTEVHGKREPTVQCVVQRTQTFLVHDQNYTETENSSTRDSNNNDDMNNEDGWITVQAKLYQAFLMSGGPSGRIARGDALVELDFVETDVEQDDEGSV